MSQGRFQRVRATCALLFVLIGACSQGRGDSQEARSAPEGRSTPVAWETHSPSIQQRTEAVAVTDGSLIYIAGGFAFPGETVSVVEVYDPEADRWREGPELPLAVDHAMAASIGGDVYILGGYRANREPSDRAFVLREGAWVELPPMPEPRAAGGAASLDGLLYVVGGVGLDGLGQTTLVFDPTSSRWTDLPGLQMPRQHLGVASDGQRIFAVGGRTGGLDTNLATSEAFDPIAGTWGRLPDLPTARGGLAAASTDNGFVVAAGGEGASTFAEAEAFNVRTGKWISLPPLPTPRHGLGVVALGDTVYVITGGPEPRLTYSAANESINLSGLRA